MSDIITIPMQPMNIYGELITENGIEVKQAASISVGTDTITIPMQPVGYGSLLITIKMCPYPIPAISADKTGGCAPLQVAFSSTDSEFLVSQGWSFGDGQSAGDADPSHEYTAGGDYPVVLTGYNQAGSKQDSATIHVLNPPIAGLSADVTSGTSPLTVNFTAVCTGDITDYDWDFGDGYTSGIQNPSHTYTTGAYDLSMIASNPYCSDEIILADYIVVSTPTPTYPRWVSKFDNTFWNATPGNGSWNGSAWVPNSNGYLELLAIGTWAAGYRPTKIRVTPDRLNPDSGYYCWLRSNLDGYPIIMIGPDGIGNINWGNYNIFGIQRLVDANLYLAGIEFYEEG